MPMSWTAIFRVVVLLVMTAHVFYLYAFARMLQEVVGTDFQTILASSSFALVMLVPLTWAVAVPDLPQIIRAHRGRRRWLRGYCPGCNYFLLNAAGNRCPECGGDRAEPRPFEFGWPTIRRFAVFAAAAWVLGCVAAESWTVMDEASFAREASAHVGGVATERYSRRRRWPMHGRTLYYTTTDGVTAFIPELILDAPDVPVQYRSTYSGLSTK